MGPAPRVARLTCRRLFGREQLCAALALGLAWEAVPQGGESGRASLFAARRSVPCSLEQV